MVVCQTARPCLAQEYFAIDNIDFLYDSLLSYPAGCNSKADCGGFLWLKGGICALSYLDGPRKGAADPRGASSVQGC